jgi:hypothetical protein
MDALVAPPPPVPATLPHGLPETPFPHGPFLVQPDGGLLPPGRPALRFAWRDRPCEARIADGLLNLSAAVGAVPYTAERAADRPAAFALIVALPAELPAGWRLQLLPDHRLRMESATALPAPVTAITLVAAMVRFALALDAYLDRLELAGVAAVSGSAGTAKT